MCSIFDKVIHTDRCQKNDREYEHDFAVQEICKKLVSRYTKSIKARVNETEILNYVT